MDDSLDLILNDGFDILAKKSIRWPKELDDLDKAVMFETMLAWFEEKEDYEKCELLRKKAKRIENRIKRMNS